MTTDVCWNKALEIFIYGGGGGRASETVLLGFSTNKQYLNGIRAGLKTLQSAERGSLN